MTKYKKAVLDIINVSHSHLTADEVYQKVKEIYPSVVLATIYNNINSLVNEGLIHKVVTPGYIDRYDYIKKHDHLICKKCGKILDINFDDYSKTLSKISGVDIIGYDLQVYYICDECKNKNK